MFDFVNYTADKAQIFLLVLIRGTGIFAMAPVLGHNSLPKTIKVGLLILLSLIVVSTLNDVTLPEIQSNWQLAGLAFKELLVGVIISLFFMLIFYAVYTAGSIVGYQIGLAMANELDKSLGTQVSIISVFWNVMAILIFLSLNGHHLVISAFADSYKLIPPAGVEISGSVGDLIIRYTAYIFIIALKISAPIIISLFLTDIALGTIAKTMPTMNVFFVGFPIKIAMGLFIMAISMPIFSYVLEKGITYLNAEMNQLLVLMGRG